MALGFLKDDKYLMSEYDFDKNKSIEINNIKLGSNKKIWWKCSKGHSFAQTVDHRYLRKSSCPYCSGKKVLEGYNDLGTVNTQLAREWAYELNGELKPQMVTGHSNKKVWWKCKECGRIWQSKVNDRANGRGCAKCSEAKRIIHFRENTYLRRGVNDLATVKPELLKEWDYGKNNDLQPGDFTCSSMQKIWWKCAVCGNEWQATISNRANNNSGCPRCMKHESTSFPEQALLYYIRICFPDTINSYRELFKDGKTELDIYIPSIKTAIEYDGKAWHDNQRARRKAHEKYIVCQSQNIKLIRLTEIEEQEQVDCDCLIYRNSLDNEGLNDAIEQVLRCITKKSIEVDVEKDKDEIRKQYIINIRNKSILANAPTIAAEWDIEKNNGMTPSMISAASMDKYWWKCEKGHSYLAIPQNRVGHGSGCPYCSNHKVWPGFNDLATRYPQIAIAWDYTKNAPVVPEEVMPGSVKKYWWKCEKGHSYMATPNARVSKNSGCPYCSNQKVLPGYNDLKTTNPEVVRYWDCERNKDILPDMVLAGSHKLIWWKCSEGHSWKKIIQGQVRANNCPVCEERTVLKGTNDLATKYPLLAEEWDNEKNAPLRPDMITRRCTKKVWWRCSGCGTEWETRVDLRVRGHGCPNCGYKVKMKSTWAAKE